MKNDRVFLAEWFGEYSDNYHDIPWPMVHEWVGHDAIRWINSQNMHDAQLIIEQGTDFSTGIVKLYVEFFRPSLRSEFALRFAK